MTDTVHASHDVSRRPLDVLQRWMQSVITHADGVVTGVNSEAARHEIAISDEQIETVICPSHALTSLERLNVYANAYYARLIECLREEFSALVQAIGESGFDALAFSYLQDYPSKSYTLAELGENFPQHLVDTRPPRETGDTPDWIDFLIDLARLERLYGDVFDGPGIERIETLQIDDLLSVPQERWHLVRFATAPCLRLAMFRFPVQEYASAARNRDENADEEIPIPEPAETFLVVSRIRFRVRRWSLSRTAYDLLSALVAGNTLQEAIEAAVADSDVDDETVAANLRDWFEEWASAGFFLSVLLD